MVQFSGTEEPISNLSRPTIHLSGGEKLLLLPPKTQSLKTQQFLFLYDSMYMFKLFSSKCENSTFTWIKYFQNYYSAQTFTCHSAPVSVFQT